MSRRYVLAMGPRHRCVLLSVIAFSLLGLLSVPSNHQQGSGHPHQIRQEGARNTTVTFLNGHTHKDMDPFENKIAFSTDTFPNIISLTDSIQTATLNAKDSEKFFNINAPQTMTFQKPEYVPEARNPCFYTDISSRPYLSEAERRQKYRLTCLPLVYFIGVSKAGTSDLHAKLVQHQHLVEGVAKEAHFWNLNKRHMTSWFKMALYTEIYQYFASAVHNCCLNNNTTCHVDNFTPGPENDRVLKGLKNGLENVNYKIKTFMYDDLKERIAKGKKCPLLTVDSTPRSIYDGINWELDPLNKGLDEPHILTADRIHHFVPNAKAILLLRDPVARTLSDFRYFGGGSQAQQFHDRVTAGIKWWNNCLNQLSERRCAFGLYYQDQHLPNLPGDMSWGTNGAGRLRLSMYIIYIRKWLEVFPRENLLILNSQVFDENPLKTLTEIVYPFLELEPMSAIAKQNLQELLDEGHLHITKKHQFTPQNETVGLLKGLFAPYNRQLAQLTGDPSFLWP